MRIQLIAALTGFLLLAQTLPLVAADKADPEAIIFVRIPNKPDGKPGIYYEPFMYHFGRSAHVPGSQIVKLSPPTPDGELTVLTEDFHGVEEPEVSYDGRKILFAGQKTAKDGWEVWEMNIDGTGKRQITEDMADVCSPCYLADGRIVFSSTRHVAMEPERRRDEYDRDHARLAHRCNHDGSNVEQISFNISSDSEFIVMRDGRVMFQSWQHHGMRYHTSGASAFFTMNPDGTGFIDYWGNQRGGFRWKQREMPDGRIVFLDSTFHHCYGGGQLGMITPGDPNDPKTLQVLTPDVNKYGPDSPGGRYRDPYPTQDGRLMTVWSPGPAWSAYRNPEGPIVNYGIYWFDFEKKKAGGPIYNDPKYQSLNPIPLEPHPTPEIVPDHGIDPGMTSGTLLCLNAYLGQLDKEAFIQPGQIKKVRIIEGFGIHDEDPFFRTFPPGVGYSSFGSSSNSISNFEQKRVVGEAPVAEDGSFYVEVPADTVLHWQTLDENDMALQDALTWAWVRPGERRACVGCHENRTTTPDLPAVPLATKLPPVALNIPPEQRHTVDFRRDLTPIIENKCTECHNTKRAEAGLDLSEGDDLVYLRMAHRSTGSSRLRAAVFNKAYLNLSAAATGKLGKYIHPGFARKSPLIWRLHGHSFPYDAKVNQCPPNAPLSAEEKAKFALWVDLGAQWDNLPGDDEYLSYSKGESTKLAAAHDKTIPAIHHKAIAAAENRCMECHPLTKALSVRKTPDEWRETVEKMGAKRKGWIMPEEVDLIAAYLSEITDDAGLIRNWKICGPFDNTGGAAIRTALGPEQSLDFAASYPGRNKKPAAWKQVDLKDATGVLDFESHFGKINGATAYAYTNVRSDRDKLVTLRLSGDDMFELFVNGERVLQRLMAQAFDYDKDIIPVRLVEGENHILVKVHDINGVWRLRARLTESDRPGSPAYQFVPEAITSVD
ncbi:MAG: hypothetical protein GY903_34045 [Fuerstiella sp.]|nr:hypothetical protein [Fuerstiella sp.]MCP4859517.1 hypothetical protein [Fuerstiella sp.]